MKNRQNIVKKKRLLPTAPHVPRQSPIQASNPLFQFVNTECYEWVNKWQKIFRSSTFMKKDIGTYISIGWLLLNRFFFNYHFFQLFHVFIINYFVHEFFIRQKMIDDQLYFSHFVIWSEILTAWGHSYITLCPRRGEGVSYLNPLNHNTLLHKLHNKGGGGSQKQENKP